MSDSAPASPLRGIARSAAVDTAIRLALIGLFAYWSLLIIQPFLIVGLWGVILAVALYPIFDWLQRCLGGHRKLAAGLVTATTLIVLIVPATILSTTLLDNLRSIAQRMIDGSLRLPPPSAAVQRWPIIGDEIYEFWDLASDNLADALNRVRPQLKPIGLALLAAAANAGITLLKFAASVIVAGFVFVPGARLALGIRAFAERLATGRGQYFVDLAGATIRNIARGVIGVSLLQSLLVGIALIVVAVPGAGLITVAALVLGLLQIGPGIPVIGVIIWGWLTLDATYAVLLTAYLIPVTLVDNVLKPFVMSRGLETPMLVVFVGVLGGVVAHGLIGLFVGPIVLAVAYELVVSWVAGGTSAPPSDGETPARAHGPQHTANGI
jgi:predicted PurR-regulated permease PerM